jgi:hypothetical protein
MNEIAMSNKYTIEELEIIKGKIQVSDTTFRSQVEGLRQRVGANQFNDNRHSC